MQPDSGTTPDSDHLPDPGHVGDYLISSRSFDEYRAMFALTDSDLSGSVLDCPGGASSFTALANQAGASAIAADPAYARPRDYMEEIQRCSAHTEAGSDHYVWGFYGDFDGYSKARLLSGETFSQDLIAHPARYVPVSLPEIPFPDGQFDLVLSSHFLFSYADRLDLEFHRAALRELHRVARREVRVFPLVDHSGRPVPALMSELLATLETPHRVERVDYEFQRGGNEMLVLTAIR